MVTGSGKQEIMAFIDGNLEMVPEDHVFHHNYYESPWINMEGALGGHGGAAMGAVLGASMGGCVSALEMQARFEREFDVIHEVVHERLVAMVPMVYNMRPNYELGLPGWYTKFVYKYFKWLF